MIGGFRSVLCVSVFQGSLLVIIIMIDGSEKRDVKAAFELYSSHIYENRNKIEDLKCQAEFFNFGSRLS